MQLTIGQNLTDNRVKLEYKEYGKKSLAMPSYKIDETKADEFVKKYNKESSNLSKFTAGLTAFGMICAYKTPPSCSKLTKFIIRTPIGAAIGALSGSYISYNRKNTLMEKYGVEKF